MSRMTPQPHDKIRQVLADNRANANQAVRSVDQELDLLVDDLDRYRKALERLAKCREAPDDVVSVLWVAGIADEALTGITDGRMAGFTSDREREEVG